MPAFAIYPSLKDTGVFVTGGASGIGAEIVRAFADQAAIAIANTRLIEAVERQRTELARFLSPQVAELISSADGEQLLGSGSTPLRGALQAAGFVATPKGLRLRSTGA